MKNKSIKISNPAEVLPVVKRYRNCQVEYFLAISLNSTGDLIKLHMITKGILNRTVVHPREVFIPILKDHAASAIIVHNHPSGHTDPSGEDDKITDRLHIVGEILGIPVLDHVIISKNGYYSYQENRKMDINIDYAKAVAEYSKPE